MVGSRFVERYKVNGVPVEECWNAQEDPRRTKQKKHDLAYAQVGNFTIANGKENIPGDTFFYSPSIMELVSHTSYTLTAVTALLDIDVKGKRVLDLGCGDGALSMVALARGASNVVGLDKDVCHEKQFERSAERIGAIERATFKKADLITIGLLDKLHQLQPQVLIANIGPQYEIAHEKSRSLAEISQSIETVVMGGYAESNDQWGPIPTAFYLRKAGFNLHEMYASSKHNLAFVMHR